MLSDSHHREYVYTGLSFLQVYHVGGDQPFDLILDFWHTWAVCVIGWSVPLGPLSTLGTRGAAVGLIVGVDAQPGLNHHHTVVTSVPAVFICDLWTAGYCVADLLLCRFGVQVTFLAVLFVWCQTPYLPHL